MLNKNKRKSTPAQNTSKIVRAPAENSSKKDIPLLNLRGAIRQKGCSVTKPRGKCANSQSCQSDQHFAAKRGDSTFPTCLFGTVCNVWFLTRCSCIEMSILLVLHFANKAIVIRNNLHKEYLFFRTFSRNIKYYFHTFAFFLNLRNLAVC